MIALLLPAIGFGWLLYAFHHAPEGYEDEDGFHYGHPFRIQSLQDSGNRPSALVRTIGRDSS
jgi:hypothetical protein